MRFRGQVHSNTSTARVSNPYKGMWKSRQAKLDRGSLLSDSLQDFALFIRAVQMYFSIALTSWSQWNKDTSAGLSPFCYLLLSLEKGFFRFLLWRLIFWEQKSQQHLVFGQWLKKVCMVEDKKTHQVCPPPQYKTHVGSSWQGKRLAWTNCCDCWAAASTFTTTNQGQQTNHLHTLSIVVSNKPVFILHFQQFRTDSVKSYQCFKWNYAKQQMISIKIQTAQKV